MTTDKLKQAVCDIKQHREDIISKLVQFSKTDSLLFWDKNSAVVKKQEKLWAPILKWAGEYIQAKYTPTDELKVREQDQKSMYAMRKFMENMSDKELAAFYLASMNMRSELLAAALVKGHINADQAYNAAYLEELHQAELWGHDKQAEKRRQCLKNELVDIENFLKK